MCPSAPPWRRSSARTMETSPPSSSRRSCDSVRSSPPAIRLATASVGLVSPRSTWLSIGALTPLRCDRSRSERPMASRSALTRSPCIRAYVIAYALADAVRASGPADLALLGLDEHEDPVGAGPALLEADPEDLRVATELHALAVERDLAADDPIGLLDTREVDRDHAAVALARALGRGQRGGAVLRRALSHDLRHQAGARGLRRAGGRRVVRPEHRD